VTDVVIDFFEAKERLRREERRWEPPPIQKTLVLAEEFQRRIAAGAVTRADLARIHGITRARVTQVLNLLRLHPAVVEFLRAQPAGPHARRFTERRVRPLLALDRERQLDEARLLLNGFQPPTNSKTA
jgi:hypothetical protein